MAKKKGIDCKKVPTAAGRGACKLMKAAKGGKLMRKSAVAAKNRRTT